MTHSGPTACLFTYLWLAVTGCCDDTVRFVELSLRLPASTDADLLVVGDTATVWAAADTGPPGRSCTLYVSRVTPGFSWPVQAGRFAFESSDSTVAAFGARGFLTAVRVGEATLAASSEGVNSTPLLLKVLPRP